MSFDREVTLATFTPAPNSSSYRVTDGPTVRATRRVSTPWAASAATSATPAASTSCSSTAWGLPRFNRLDGGRRQSPMAGPSFISSCSPLPGRVAASRSWTGPADSGTSTTGSVPTGSVPTGSAPGTVSAGWAPPPAATARPNGSVGWSVSSAPSAAGPPVRPRAASAAHRAIRTTAPAADLIDTPVNRMRATTTSATSTVAAAGGWVGAVIGDPLRAALGGIGAATVLVALVVVALILFTGVSIRSAAGAVVRMARWVAEAARGRTVGPGADGAEETDHPTDPFGRAVAAGGGAQPALTVPGADPVVADPVGTDPVVDVPESAGPVQLLEAATRPGKGEQLEMKLGPAIGDWRLPPSNLLKRGKPQAVDEHEVDAAGVALVAALAAHGVETRLVARTVGPSVSRYELELGAGVKVARVTSLSKDIAYAMASPDVRILAPIPGKSAIGVEVPNRRRELVALGDILASPEAAGAHHPLEVALGRDIAGRAVMVNLAAMPHVLVSGATGSGKSSCINSILTSILTRATPDQVRLILVDPKRVELGQYNDLPHLLTQVVVDPKKAANALSWAVKEMERRYDLLAEAGMRDITGYNVAVDGGPVSY